MRNRIRRALALLFSALMLLLPAGCSPPESFKGTLTLWQPAPADAGDALSARLAERVKAFERSHPGVTVQVASRPAAELEQALDQSWKGGEGPDLALAPLRPDWVKAGYLQTLDDLLPQEEAADFVPSTLEAARLGGRLYGVPAGAEPVLLLLNLDVFERRGVAPPADGRWTPEQFDSVLRALAATAPGAPSGASAGTDVATYGLGYYVLPGFHEFWPLWAQDAAVTDPATGHLDLRSQELKAGVTRLAGWTQASGLVWPGAGRKGPEELWRAFTGKEAQVAMAPWGPWALPLLTQGPFETRVQVAAFPAASGGSTLGQVRTYLVRRQENPLKAKTAMELALALTDPETQHLQATRAGVLPVRRSAAGSLNQDPLLSRAAALVGEMRPLPADRARLEQMDRLQQRVLYALLGALTPEAALEGGGAGGPTTP